MNPLTSLIGTVASMIVPFSAAADALGATGATVWLGAFLTAVTLWRLIVAPVQRMSNRIERLPYIESRIRNVENELGIRPPVDPAAK